VVLETKQFLIEQAESCYRALAVFEDSRGDLSDALRFTLCNNADFSETMTPETMTFDKKEKSVAMKPLSH